MNFLSKISSKVEKYKARIEEKLGDLPFPKPVQNAAVNITGTWNTPIPLQINQTGNDIQIAQGPFTGTGEVHGFNVTLTIAGATFTGVVNKGATDLTFANGSSWSRRPNAIVEGTVVTLSSFFDQTPVASDGSRVYRGTIGGSDSQFTIVKIDREDGEQVYDKKKVAFKHVQTNRFLFVCDTGALGFVDAPSAKSAHFRIMGNDNSGSGTINHGDSVFIRTYMKTWLCARDDGNVTADVTESQTWEEFHIFDTAKPIDNQYSRQQAVLFSNRQVELLVDRVNDQIDIPFLPEEHERKLITKAVQEINLHIEPAMRALLHTDYVDLLVAMLDDFASLSQKKKKAHEILSRTLKVPLTDHINKSIDLPILDEGQEHAIIQRIVDMILKMVSNFSIEGVERSGFA